MSRVHLGPLFFLIKFVEQTYDFEEEKNRTSIQSLKRDNHILSKFQFVSVNLSA